MIADRLKFKHRAQITVRNNEIDWQGIVHNAVYLHYFEVGRMGYFETIGFPIVIGPGALEHKVVIGRNELDYRSSARFNETLDVYTRIAWIRNTSFALRGFIEEATTKRLVAENVSLHVWLNQETGEPALVPNFFRMLVRKFEGEDVLITPLTVPDN
ncbi:acyl-CoA thioesterase [Sphingobacteriales bacterium CHB3]|nr:acyl-CoA thioesterase [Sphingobacteriales bacterium CHB3]